uniref:SAM domain-containing protein n=1 Tax=Plectus sambesii TaxID=2011161 RepID=A0A914V0N3_9BILA
MGTRTRACGRGAISQRLLLLCLICLCLFVEVSASKSRKIVVTAEREKERDKAGFEALRQLHKQMDDDQSGSIDRKESLGFLKEDMNIAEADRLKRREKAFHHNDESITVDDLWESWFESEERNWSVDQAVDWLTNAVQLPQYVEAFQKNAVDGQTMPRLALQNSSFMLNVLGIKNSVHRQKIQVKAMDVVLFGYRDGNSRAKDVALALLLIGLVTVLVIFKVHKSRSKQELEQLSSKMHELKSLEDNFQGMQEKFEEERKKRQEMTEKLADGSENNEEVEYVEASQ